MGVLIQYLILDLFIPFLGQNNSTGPYIELNEPSRLYQTNYFRNGRTQCDFDQKKKFLHLNPAIL